MLRNLMERVSTDFTTGTLSIIFRFGFKTCFKERDKLFLVFGEEGVGIASIKVKEVGLNGSIFYFVKMKLRQAF
jgi:hypothetical protein